MNEPSLIPLSASPWAPLVDHRRIRSADVLDCLRRLVRQAVDHVLASGPAPRMNRRDADCLRPFLRAIRFAPGVRAATAGRVDAMLLLSPRAPHIGNNDVAVMAESSSERRGFIAALYARFFAARSALVGGSALLACFEEIASADPALSERAMMLARGEWRRRTLFHPDEPVWPQALSPAAFHLLLALTLERSRQRGLGRLFGPRHSALLERLEAGLPRAIEILAGRLDVEQMIVADAAKKTLPSGSRPAHVAVARLPICRLPAYVALRALVAESKDVESEKNSGNDGPDPGPSSPTPLVVRLGAGSF